MTHWTNQFEFHLTLDTESSPAVDGPVEFFKNYPLFEKFCRDKGGKASVIDNLDKNGFRPSQHIMLTYRCRTDNWKEVLGNLKTPIKALGDFSFIREKVECSVIGQPLNTALKNGYFEAHFKTLEFPSGVVSQSSVCEWGYSENVMKANAYYYTLRMPSKYGSVMDFVREIAAVQSTSRLTFPEIEYCLYDTNPGLDEDWIIS